MKQVTVTELLAEIEFAERAAKYFEEHHDITTYTDGEIEPGCYFAIRWGFGNDCVLVLKLDENYEQKIYANIIKKQDD